MSYQPHASIASVWGRIHNIHW